jgi:hypothetical protein
MLGWKEEKKKTQAEMEMDQSWSDSLKVCLKVWKPGNVQRPRDETRDDVPWPACARLLPPPTRVNEMHEIARDEWVRAVQPGCPLAPLCRLQTAVVHVVKRRRKRIWCLALMTNHGEESRCGKINQAAA